MESGSFRIKLAEMIGAGFFLDEATAGERTARDRLTYDAWGGRLTREQYLDRERILRQTEHGRHAMHTWVLRLSSRVIVASCETFRLPLSPRGAIEVIASVYVERPLRGVKMASRMMEALVQSRREAGIDALLLFSEVGTEIYARAGFKPLPAPVRSWGNASGESVRPVEWLTRDDLGSALESREAVRDGRVDVRLTESVIDWHLERAAFYRQTLGLPGTDRIGARCGGVQAIWVPDFKNNVLRVLDATGPADVSLEPVIEAACRESAALGLDGVELWDDPVSARLQGGAVRLRDDDIPMGQAFSPIGELFLGAVSRACWA